jgi:vacuole morphology and inheritance protein 14
LVEEDINVKFLVQLDKLIRLLETPIFTYLRLQLLEPGRYTWLLKTLYGLLMLLPQQSAAFKILRTRLKTVPTYSFSGGDQQISRASSVPFSQYMHHHEDGDRKEDNNINTSHQGINFDARLQQFENVQNQHRGLARSKVNYSYSSSSSSTSKEVRRSEEQQQQQQQQQQQRPPPSSTSSSVGDNNRPPSRSSRKGPGQLQL